MRYGKRGLTEHDKARATPGFTLFSPLGRVMKTVIVNMDGDVVHEWDLPDVPGNYTHLLPSGNLLAATRVPDGPMLAAKGGLIQELDWDGNVVWEHVDDLQHHDFRQLPNGNLIYIAWEKMSAEHVARVKADFEAPKPGDTVWADVIREVDRSGKIVWEWRVCEHMDIEKYPLSSLSTPDDYGHANTVCPMADGNIMVSFRSLDLVAVIDRNTRKFIWERKVRDWGGPHDPQQLDNGNFMVFANRDGMIPRGSAVIEFDPKTNDSVWEYWGNPTQTFESCRTSGCQRLSSGNTLICEGVWGRIFEVTREGDIVWEYVNPYITKNVRRGPSQGDVSGVFRAFRHAADSSEIRGRLDGRLYS